MDCQAKLCWKESKRNDLFHQYNLELKCTSTDERELVMWPRLSLSSRLKVKIVPPSVHSVNMTSVDNGEGSVIFNEQVTDGLEELYIKNAPSAKLKEFLIQLHPQKPRPKSNLARKLSYGGKMLAASFSRKQPGSQFYSSSSLVSTSQSAVKRPLTFEPRLTLKSLGPVVKRSLNDVSNSVQSFMSHSPTNNKKRKLDSSPTGFANLGNTCYLNAVLQSLLGLRCFALDLVQSQCARQVGGDSLFRMLYLLVRCKYNGDSMAAQIILVKKIYRIICSRARKFAGFNEQDAHELLSHCLDMLRNDISQVLSLPNMSGATCPVEINFSSRIEQRLTCLKCHHTVVSYEEVLDLSLHLIESSWSNLQELLEDYFQSEEVEYTCYHCNSHGHKLSKQFSSLPRVLVLTLKRYSVTNGSCNKCMEPVQIPRYLNLKPVSKDQVNIPSSYNDCEDILGPLLGGSQGCTIVDQTESQSEKSIKYRLSSVISHVGTASTGHYVSDIYCPVSGNWWHCNDSLVHVTTEEQVKQSLQTKAYILFYIHK